MYLKSRGGAATVAMSLLFSCIFIVSANVYGGAMLDNGYEIIYELPDYISESYPLTTAAAANPVCVPKPVYRFQNTVTTGHFFTINEDEKNYVVGNLPQLNYEGIGFYAFDKLCTIEGGTTQPPVFSPSNGTWQGPVFSFNIVENKSISPSGSILYYGSTRLSWKLVVKGSYCTEMTLMSSDIIPVTNNKISFGATFAGGRSLTVEGQFTSANVATGTYVYKGLSGECQGSGTWGTSH